MNSNQLFVIPLFVLCNAMWWLKSH